MPCCEISDRPQMSKTIIAVRHFGLGGRKSLETAVIDEKFASDIDNTSIDPTSYIKPTNAAFSFNEIQSGMWLICLKL